MTANTTQAATSRTGFTVRIPHNWNKWWVLMWLTAAPAVIVSAFFLPFSRWVVAAIIGFLVPELISIQRKKDSLPPLTHTIRHFLPNWLAFPLIYASLGSVGAYWLSFPRPFGVGALMGLLGWLTDHFIVTYGRPDPFPYSQRTLRLGTDRSVMPA
jgi:hypothetical protein